MNPFRMLRDARHAGLGGVTLQRRLLMFFLLFLVALMAALFIILFACGIFSAGLREQNTFLTYELGHITDNMETNLATISLEGTALSAKLTAHMEKLFSERNINPAALQASPDELEGILDSCLDILLSALEKNRASGAYLILDATVNPLLANAAHSRAGLFLKNMEPNAVHLDSPAIRFMRGPASLARSHNMTILPQWQMEFLVSTDDFFHTTMQAASGSDLPLSRLYRWNGSEVLAGDYQEAILLTVPLIASDGSVYGVCGVEISAMLFKLQYLPDNTNHIRIFSVLAPLEGNALQASKGLFAGSFTFDAGTASSEIEIEAGSGGFNSFTTPKGAAFTGLYSPIDLYPKDSAYAGEDWAVGIMLPSENFDAVVQRQTRTVIIMLCVLLALSAAASLIISQRYLKPVIGAINQVKAKPGGEYKKTNILEMDDLFDYLAQQDMIREAKPGAVVSNESVSDLYQAFVAGIKTLSPAEKAVFNLYMEGYSAKQITDILCLSINTIKTHNRRIYIKLNVTTRSELMVYVNMMREKEGLAFVGRDE